MQNNIDASANFLVGGQIRGEPPRLFNVYSEGNFIEATPDTCYFQIGETKYGKPIIDRVIKRGTQPRRRHQVHDGLVRLDDALEHLGRAADRPAGLRGGQPHDQAPAADRGDRRLLPDGPPRSGARACAGSSRSCPIPTGPDERTPMAIRVALQHRTTLSLRPPRQALAARDPAAAGAALPHADPRLLAERRAGRRTSSTGSRTPTATGSRGWCSPSRPTSSRSSSTSRPT